MPDNYIKSENLEPVEIRDWTKETLTLSFFFDTLELVITDEHGWPAMLLLDPEKLDEPDYLESLKAARVYYDAFKSVTNGWLCAHDTTEYSPYIEFYYIAGMFDALRQKLIVIPAFARVKIECVIDKRVRRLSPHPGYVYLVQAVAPQNMYKIGYSANPVKRIESLGVKLPFPIEPLHLIPTNDTRVAERQFHDQYASKRVNGEWFSLTPDDVSHICSVDYVDTEADCYE